MIHKVNYGDTIIDFEIKRTNRKTLEISVLPDASVLVVAPQNIEIEKILEKVKKRASWILEQQNYFRGFSPKQATQKYVGGETHYYLGKQYQLKLIESNYSMVKLKGKYINIYTKNKEDKEYNKKLLYKWYRDHAKIKFEEILDKLLSNLKVYQFEKPNLEIRRMKSRWGTCLNDKNKIVLNIELIKAPKYCIEYIMIHELTHFKYPNHRKEFYHFLRLILPDWEKRKDRLEMTIISS